MFEVESSAVTVTLSLYQLVGPFHEDRKCLFPRGLSGMLGASRFSLSAIEVSFCSAAVSSSSGFFQ